MIGIGDFSAPVSNHSINCVRKIVGQYTIQPLPRRCSSVSRVSERSRSGATLLAWLQITPRHWSLGKILAATSAPSGNNHSSPILAGFHKWLCHDYLELFSQICVAVILLSWCLSFGLYSLVVLPPGGFHFNLQGLVICEPYYLSR